MKSTGKRKSRCLSAEVIIDNTGRVFLKNIHGDMIRLASAISPGQRNLPGRLQLLNSIKGGKQNGSKKCD